MLKIHFINVAEGDAILLQQLDGNTELNILVDTGRADLQPSPESLRILATEYLAAAHVRHLDALILTHLHIDHAGGLGNVIQQVTVDHLFSSYFPKDATLRAKEEPHSEHHIAEVITDLNRFSGNLQILKDQGCSFHQVLHDAVILQNKQINVRLICAEHESVSIQNLIYDNILCNEALPADIKKWSADVRNMNSLRVIIEYAAKRIELDGDYNNDDWEKQEIFPCDILKVSHHGDIKALTEHIADKLHPRYAVISCQSEYVANKDRPSQRTIALLRKYGATVYYTDNFAEKGREPIYWRAVCFAIEGDGTIICPA